MLTGLSDAGSIEISAGLSDNDEIISSYSTQLHDGVAISQAPGTEAP